MWVADMDFRAPEPVLSALHEAITHGVFGYVFPSQSFIDAVIDWQRIRHGWCPESSWLLHTHGVVAGLSQIIRALTSENDAILVQTRSEEHTSELQSLMRISYAVFCLKKKKTK